MQPHPDLLIYLILCFLSFLLVMVLTPYSVALAKKLGAMDYPEARKVHAVPIPRLGGLAIAVSIVITMMVGYAVNPYLRAGLPSLMGIAARGRSTHSVEKWPLSPLKPTVISGRADFCHGLIGPGLLIILAMGVYDDVRNASAIAKLLTQIVAAGLAVALGIQFQLASNPLADRMINYFDLGSLSIPLTMLWIVGLTNAFNLIDGLDGLATGIGMFASMALFLISLQQGAGLVTYVYACVFGATFAFLRFARHPATVFMGDCGAMFLGFLLACLSVMGTQKSYTVAALFIPLIVFGVPIFDATVTLIRRYLKRGNVWLADREHIHHRLLSIGLNQRQVVIILYAISIVLGIIAFAFTVLLDEYAAVILGIIGLLGGFTAKELKVFGTSRPPMERELRYKQNLENEEERERERGRSRTQ